METTLLQSAEPDGDFVDPNCVDFLFYLGSHDWTQLSGEPSLHAVQEIPWPDAETAPQEPPEITYNVMAKSITTPPHQLLQGSHQPSLVQEAPTQLPSNTTEMVMEPLDVNARYLIEPDSDHSWMTEDNLEEWQFHFQTELKMLKEDDTRFCYVTSMLSSRQRRQLHAMAHLGRLAHMSIGSGKAKRVLITKCEIHASSYHSRWSAGHIQAVNGVIDPRILTFHCIRYSISLQSFQDCLKSNGLPAPSKVAIEHKGRTISSSFGRVDKCRVRAVFEDPVAAVASVFRLQRSRVVDGSGIFFSVTGCEYTRFFACKWDPNCCYDEPDMFTATQICHSQKALESIADLQDSAWSSAPALSHAIPQGGIRREPCEACDRCRSKSMMCVGEGEALGVRCQADQARCVFKTRETKRNKLSPDDDYVEMVEQERIQLIAATQELYRLLVLHNVWSGANLPEINGHTRTHDILTALGLSPYKRNENEKSAHFEDARKKLEGAPSSTNDNRPSFRHHSSTPHPSADASPCRMDPGYSSADASNSSMGSVMLSDYGSDASGPKLQGFPKWQKFPKWPVFPKKRRLPAGSYACSFGCGKVFEHNGDRTKHEKVHQTERPYQCDECGHGFMYPKDVRRHCERTGHTSAIPAP